MTSLAQIIALSKDAAIKYGSIGISDIRPNTSNDGIIFELVDASTYNIPLTSMDIMQRTIYDSNNNGNVDNADNSILLNNKNESYYLDYSNFTNIPTNLSDFIDDLNGVFRLASNTSDDITEGSVNKFVNASDKELIRKNKGYFPSLVDLLSVYPDGDPSLEGGEFAFVDDIDLGLYLYEYTPIRNKWVQDATANWISRDELNNEGIVLKSYNTLNPVDGDYIFKKTDDKILIYSWSSIKNAWIESGEISHSFHSDYFIVNKTDGAFRQVNENDLDINVHKVATTPNSQYFGDVRSNNIFIGSSGDIVKVEDNSLNNYDLVTSGSTTVNVDKFVTESFTLVLDNAYFQGLSSRALRLEKLNFTIDNLYDDLNNPITDSKVHIAIYDQTGDKKIYETGSIISLPMDIGVDVSTGLNILPVKNLVYLLVGNTYRIEITCLNKSKYIGSTFNANFLPKSSIEFYTVKEFNIYNEGNINELYSNLGLKNDGTGLKFLSDDGTYKSSGGGGGSSFFIDLLDTPSSYIGESNKIVKVNSTEDKVEFVDGTFSIFGRTGNVVASSGDYMASQVTNAYDKSSDTLDDISDGSTFVKTHNNFTDAEKTKLGNIEDNAQVNTINSVNSKTGSVVLNKEDIGLENVLNVEQIPISEKGMNNGVATLDTNGKVPTSQIPDFLLGKAEYKGVWDANSNTPTLISGNGTIGFYYAANVAGTTNLDGNNNWNIGDIVIFNGSVWERIESGNNVISVNDKVGVVELTSSDISYDNTESGMDSVLVKNVIDELDVRRMNQGSGIINIHPTLTDNGDGTIDISSSEVVIYSNSTFNGKSIKYTVPSTTNMLLNNEIVNYVVVNYNSGNPQYQVTTTVGNITESDIVPVFTIYRQGTELQILDWKELGNGKIDKLHQRLVKTQRFARESGLKIGYKNPLSFTVSGGKVWYGANSISIPAISDSSSVTFGNSRKYYKSGGNWSYLSTGQLENFYYQDTATGELSTLSNGRYAVNWIYKDMSNTDKVYFLIGQDNYRLNDVQSSQPPQDVPSVIKNNSMLIGRIIIKKNDTDVTQVDSAFDVVFNPSGIVSHNDLSDIDMAGNGVINGHVNDINQTIYGSKNFTEPIVIIGNDNGSFKINNSANTFEVAELFNSSGNGGIMKLKDNTGDTGVFLCAYGSNYMLNNLGIKNNDPKGILDVNPTNVDASTYSNPYPRVTTVQMGALTNMLEGSGVYNIDDNCKYTFNGTSWIRELNEESTPISPHTVGDVKTSLNSTDHDGWLILNGAPITAEIYTKIQTVGMEAIWTQLGGTNNTRPDFRGYVLGMATSASDYGDKVGSKEKDITTAMIPEHDHTIVMSEFSGDSADDGSHSHTTTATTAQSTDNSLPNRKMPVMVSEDGSKNWGVYSCADGTSHYCIGRSSNDYEVESGSGSVFYQHNHSFDVPSTSTNSTGSHNHDITHNHTVSTTALTPTEKIDVTQPTVMLNHFLYLG